MNSFLLPQSFVISNHFCSNGVYDTHTSYIYMLVIIVVALQNESLMAEKGNFVFAWHSFIPFILVVVHHRSTRLIDTDRTSNIEVVLNTKHVCIVFCVYDTI